jgi:hypothetical protein
MDFKPIRNKIRKFSYDSLVEHLLTLLRKFQAESTPQPFWHPLVILKWTLEFAGEQYPSREATFDDVLKMISQLEKLEMSHRTFTPSTNGRLSKMFTILAPQQFLYQDRVWVDTFARQYILFARLKKSYSIEEAFATRTGLEVIDVIAGLQLLWFMAYNHLPNSTFYGTFTDQNWKAFQDTLGPKKARNFAKLLEISRHSIKGILANDKRVVRNYDLQVFETSIFARRPLLIHNNRIVIPHRGVLGYTVNHFLYDYMKQYDEAFAPEFGERVEEYLELGLKENSIPYLNEDQLRQRIGKKHKVTDYLVENEILIECKAIELRPHINVDPTDEVLSDEFRSSIVKAYAHQMLSVAAKLSQHVEYYGIIITYKELHLGDTNDIWEQFLGAETMKVVSDHEIIKKLPKKNLFFINLASWDLIMEMIKVKGLTLKQILIDARKAHAQEEKFGFYMHLDSYKVRIEKLKYLNETTVFKKN